ncbi:Elongator subunit elp2 [Coemansia sp. RSA 1813]|nr:Elongator subunit elp2 [Coemansia sp. RSA 1646]KAJ1772508.1 Elongator subunit elp2 [Coemansia sp. RSA 1843]KAJ2090911.1 Elongator subunit elp2 [Coemansia sp. RSA 986]KAJ2214021.1 Elongator subunit elp2 [Coemansia sp. RSA 487]KAJ2571261.1 Elongator subunit elp2 [Coemansia sp. RSA 1813]
MVKTTTELISTACSRTAHALDWYDDSLIAFGAGNFVALYDPSNTMSKRGISATLQGHTKRVNCVQFARTVAGDTASVLVSGSADCTARIWRRCSDPQSWECAAVLDGHKNAVIAVATMHLALDGGLTVTVTAGTDGTLRVYEYHDMFPTEGKTGDGVEHLSPTQTIDVGTRNALAVALTVIPVGAGASNGARAIVLATGNTDNKVHVYTRGSAPGDPFAKALSLSGHEDWVTSLSFLMFQPNASSDSWTRNATISHWQPGDVVLASGSEDKYIRLWRIHLISSTSSTSTSSIEGEDMEQRDGGYDAGKKAAQAVLDALTDSLRTGTSIEDAANSIAAGDGLLAKSGGGTSSDKMQAAQLSTRAHVMTTTVGTMHRVHAVSLDSVLIGHDGWVHSVAWSQARKESGDGSVVLVTASGDGSIMVWMPDKDAGVWSSVARLGEVGGAVLGFLGAVMDPSGTSICAYGYHGSFHSWTNQRNAQDTSGARSSDMAIWKPVLSPSGHFGSVQDVCWDPHGSYMLSVSLDQTTRLYAPWVDVERKGTPEERRISKGWHEIARPQIHGYDMRCAAFVSAFQYVSGADEKVVRVFQATQQFVSSWRATAGVDSVPESIDGESQKLSVGAALPVLGLSNKAVEETQVQALLDATSNSEGMNDTYQVRQTHTDVVASATIARAQRENQGPPLEEDLLRHTLWPEVDKLYGHPYEIFSVAAAHAGDWVAAACKATSERFAGIRLYSTRTWQPPVIRTKGDEATGVAAPLAAHSLTITRIRFSPPSPDADKYLLSVSRDRSWALYERTPADPDQRSDGTEVYGQPTGPYRLVRRQQKAHMRIIWDAAWSPDARFFATASRDKTVKLWPLPTATNQDQTEEDAAARKPVALAFPEAVTAIDFLPSLVSGASGSTEYVLAAALESGRIFVLVGTCGADGAGGVPTAWKPSEVARSETHIAMVQRLAWRPRPAHGTSTTERSWQLASASDDQTVRIITVDL